MDLLKVLNKALMGYYTFTKENDDNFSITFNVYTTPVTIDIITTRVKNRFNAYETYYYLNFKNVTQSIEEKDFNAIKKMTFFDFDKAQKKKKKEV